MASDASTVAVTEALVEHQLERSGPRLAFEPALEARFEAETGLARCRMLAWQGILGTLCLIAYLAADWLVTPDVFGFAVGLRLGLLLPLVGLALLLLGRNPPAPLREGLVTLIPVLAALTTLVIVEASESPLREIQHNSIILVVLFIAMVMRVRFVYAVAGCLFTFGLMLSEMFLTRDHEFAQFIAEVVIFFAAVVMALTASWHLERESRRSYLLALREHLANLTLSELSLSDPLTGVGNRRALEREIAAIVEAAQPGEDIAIALIDIDYFKPYNDALGHLAGDQCLKHVASLLQSGLRNAGDKAFRFGGEEFLVLMRRTELSQAVGAAERLRRLVEAAAIVHPARPAPQLVTASFGVASARVAGLEFQQLIGEADAALYDAKDHGRNRVSPPFLTSKGDDLLRLRRRKAS